ncbi:glycosyltransferase family 2 protein [candidate division TA06 bacterium]|uniref:Glycosyltransferase family 2 protein n=1 Tax=candidate division TA06 bacterium TaxID=2250710 RepID=A0A933MJY9_UNCT6|nr:glycosyltransferase family 2 protein [candidate division TA06 bacterium]
MKQITVAIIARDEEATIGQVILGAKGHADELLVIDGGSTDRTAEIARREGVPVLSDDGRGKGAGVRLAIQKAQSGILVLMDADGSHQASDIPDLARPIMEGKADMMIASRLRGGSDEFHGTLDNIIRQAGGAFISLLLHWRWGADITDCENGFRAIDVQKARGLGLKSNDFLIEQEMVVKAIKKGLVIREIASHEFARQGGVSKLKTTQGWKFLWHIFKEMAF